MPHLAKMPETTELLIGSRPKPERRIWGLSRFWWAVLTFWLVVALAAGLETVLLQTISAKDALLLVFTRLGPWLFMTGLIIRISSNYLLDRAGWRRSIWVYLAAFVVSLGVVAVFTYFGPSLQFPGQQPITVGKFTGDPRSMTIRILMRMTYQVPTFWGLVAVAHAVRFYERADARKLREAELWAQLVQARLQALQLQLNPHFLFNTLNSIASLVHDNPATAEQMIEALADLLRVATTTHRQQVTVREELHFLDQYLLIERIRFGQRLQIETQIDEAMLNDMVPVLILQPLAENAVKHGIETQVGPCVLEISVQSAGDGHFLRLEVSNSGPVSNSFDRKIEERVGLSNTRARLQTMFGPQSSLEVYPRKQGGFVARMLIPRPAAALHAASPKLEATTS
jgi:two-component system LytT family sensor kinase